MLHVLLLILKVIGIILLALLGILLTLVLLALFVPLRYVVNLEKKEEEELQVHLKISWLLHILTFRLDKEEEVQYRFRVLGIPVKKKRHAKEEIPNGADNPKDRKKPAGKGNARKPVKSRKKIEQKNTLETIEQKEKTISEDTTKEDMVQEAVTGELPEQQASKQQRKKKKKKLSFFTTVRQRVLQWIQRVRQFLRKATKTKEEAVKIFKKIQAFLGNSRNRKGALVVWNAIKKIVLHIRPKKWKGKFFVGTKNPADTGKLFGVISVVGGMVGFMPPVTPDFEREIFEGKLWMKGNIRTFTLLRILFVTWRDKNVQYLVHYSKKVFSRG